MSGTGRRAVWALLLVAAASRLWLAAPLPWTASGATEHDDGLFLRLADSLGRGEWLGRYDSATLIKGPGFPLWIAGVRAFGGDLALATQILYILACLAVTAALGRWLSGSLRVALGLLLLFQPMACAPPVLRVIRETIYPSLSLLVLAGLAGICAERLRGGRRLFAWAVLLGLSSAWLWLTREEGVWLAPSAALVFAGGTWLTWRRTRSRLSGWLAAWAVAALCALAPVLSVCALNGLRYGVFGIVELKRPEFLAAYGSLQRVRDATAPPQTPVSRATRGKVYAVSAEFRKLAPHLEGRTGAIWAEISGRAGTGEIGGGWFVWALRAAADKAGMAASGGEAMQFYRRLADEVTRACDEGRLEADPRRDSLSPRFERSLAGPFLVSLGRACIALVRFDSARPVLRPSIGDSDRYAKRTGARFAPEAIAFPAFNRTWRERHSGRLALLDLLARLFALIAPAATLSALVGLPFLLRRPDMRILLALAAAAALVVRLALLAWIDAACFSAVSASYLSPLHPLLPIFWILVFATLKRKEPA